MKRLFRWSLVPLMALAACDSGGGTPTPTPTPPPANRAPAFSSAATVSVAENTSAAYTATATDADNNPLTFTISGGADAARFSITSAGALSFVNAPSFETPSDADGNNVYLVQLTVSDGTLSATLDLQVTVTDTREGIAVRRVATGFNQPINVAPVPGSSSIYVAERGGNIYRLDPATGVRTLALTLSNLSTTGENGVLGIATRSFGTTELFVLFIHQNGNLMANQYFLTNGQQRQVINVSPSEPGAHVGGWIGFASDERELYILTGDSQANPGLYAQNTYRLHGKVLRRDGNTGAWHPSSNNPFYGGFEMPGIGGNPSVFALGLRKPLRASFGPVDGRLYIGDVGETVQEINVVHPSQRALNFGWPYLQGTQPYQGTAPAGLTGPVTQYESGTGPKQGGMVIGGYVYRGPIASLTGAYVFGDGISGNLWTVPAASLVQGSVLPASSYERRNLDFTPDTGTLNSLISFGEDAAGNLFMVDYDGDIFMIAAG